MSDPTFQEYLDIKAINASGLKIIKNESALHFWYKRINPDREEEKDKADLIIGSCLHSLVFEGARIWRVKPAIAKTSKVGKGVHSLVLDGIINWSIIPEDINKGKKTKVGKPKYEAWLKTIPPGNLAVTKEEDEKIREEYEKIPKEERPAQEDLPENSPILTHDQIKLVECMADSVLSSEDALEVLAVDTPFYKTESNVVFNYGDPPETTLCKARLDLVKCDQAGNVQVVDLKSTQDASPEGFARAIANLKYHLQAAFYLEAAYSIIDQPVSAPVHDQEFKFICVEKKPPYAVAVYSLSREAIYQGAREMQEAMGIYRQFVGLEDPWPGYRMPDQGPMILDLPRWARDPLYQADGF